MLKIPYKTRGYLIHFCDNTEKLGENEKIAKFDMIKADFYRERGMRIVGILFFQILFAIVVALTTVIINMKIKHEKELEHYIKDYWKVEEELFKCELKLIKKENEE